MPKAQLMGGGDYPISCLGVVSGRCPLFLRLRFGGGRGAGSGLVRDYGGGLGAEMACSGL